MKNFLNCLLFLFMSCLLTSAYGTQIYGHRGAAGLSPENTLPAYRTALHLGVDVLDMDVGLTKDHVLIVTHNVDLNPDITRNAQEQWISTTHLPLIKDLTLKQLKTYDVGRIKPGSSTAQAFPDQLAVDHTHMPTLQQVIDYGNRVTQDKIRFQIEIKTEPTHPQATLSPQVFAQAMAQFIAKNHLAKRVEIQAFDWRVLVALHKINPNIQLAFLTDNREFSQIYAQNPKAALAFHAGHALSPSNNSLPKLIKSLGGSIWGPNYLDLTPYQVKQAQRLGLRIVTWTADTAPAMKQLLNWDVAGIITNRPDILRGLMAARGLKLPQAYPKAP